MALSSEVDGKSGYTSVIPEENCLELEAQANAAPIHRVRFALPGGVLQYTATIKTADVNHLSG
jgi:hypothetical protein